MPKSKTLRMLIALSALMAGGSASPFGGRTDWREMTVGHFHLFSTLRDSTTRDVARQLQAFEKTVGAILQSDEKLPDMPTLIYIMDGRDFLRYAAGRSNVAGMFFERPFANVIVINGDLPFDLVRVTIFHEYTHFIQRNSTAMKMPPWYVEGFAMLFSSFKLDKQRVFVGELPDGVHISWQQWIPIERVLAVKQSDPEYRAERLAGEFYGESWALVHLLLFDDKTLRGPTGRYLTALDDGLQEPEAFQAFPFDKSALDHRVRELIVKRVIQTRIITYPHAIAVDDAPITRMSAAQADAALLRLMFTLGDRDDLVSPIMDAAVKENPGDPAIAGLAARIAAHYRHPFNVGAFADSLSRGGTDQPQLRIDVADTLLMSVGSAAADPAVVSKQAFAILDGLVHAGDPPIEAALLWASAARAIDADPAAVITVLKQISLRAPHNTEALSGLAYASEALGNKSEAREYYNRIILVSEYPEERLWAQKEADSARLH